MREPDFSLPKLYLRRIQSVAPHQSRLDSVILKITYLREHKSNQVCGAMPFSQAKLLLLGKAGADYNAVRFGRDAWEHHSETAAAAVSVPVCASVVSGVLSGVYAEKRIVTGWLGISAAAGSPVSAKVSVQVPDSVSTEQE